MSGPHRTIVPLAGEVDIRTASETMAEVTEALEREQPDELVLDLSRVTFLDSVGIGFLIGLHRQAGGAETLLLLRGLQPQVRRALEATGLTDVLHLEGD